MSSIMHAAGGLFVAASFIFTGPGPANGADRIEEQIGELKGVLAGKRVGLLTNHTGVDGEFRYLSDILYADEEIELVSFFAPEHGLRGDAQAGGGIPDYIDSVTGLPVHSLYGGRRAPTPEQLAELDVVVFDIQDVGSRFYTYVWTMTHAMEAAAAAEKEFVVFDRPNAVGIDKVEGAPQRTPTSLVGRTWEGAPFGVATRHGLTAGELAKLVNDEWMDPKVALTVVRVPGYTRSMTFEDTGYPWVFPSPNMPTLDTAIVYPGTCLFEGTNLSEGRGTTRPFELIGAPFVDAIAWAETLNGLNLPGVRFRAAWFVPTFDDHSGSQCGGVQVHVTDPDTFQPVYTALHMLKTVAEQHPEEVTIRSGVSRLMGVVDLHERILVESVDDIVAGWQEDMAGYLELRAKHLLYPEN